MRAKATLGLGVLSAALIAVAPALASQDDSALRLVRHSGSGNAPLAIGSFTPASGDPRLAALLSRAGVSTTAFRFTPADTKRGNSRAVTVAVRAGSTRSAERPGEVSAAAGLTPIAYNLGASMGWKRFAVWTDAQHVDLGAVPLGRDSMEAGVSYTARRFTSALKAGADQPLPGTPRAIAEQPSYSVDVSTAYRLTRNLDVVTGVRYKAERDNRIEKLQDDRRDSQAVYVGTAFRF